MYGKSHNSQVGVIFTSKGYRETYLYPNWHRLAESRDSTTRSLSSNFNAGVSEVGCEAEYLIRIDGDDMRPRFDALNHMIEDLMNKIAARPYLCACYPTYMIYSNERLVPSIINVRKPQGAGILYKRDCFMDTHGYDESLDLQADLEFHLRFLKRHSMDISDNAIYPWYFTGKNRSFKKQREILKLRKKILKRHDTPDHAMHHFGLYHYIKDHLRR